MCKKYEFLSSFILLIVLGMFVSSCGDSGGSSGSHSQVLVSWTDESTDAALPVTNLRMVKIVTTTTNSASPLTSTIAVVNGTLTTVSDIRVWWNTEDNFATATQVGVKASPDVGGAYKITLTGAGNATGFLYYTISIPGGQVGTYSLRVLSIEGEDKDQIPLPQSTASRNVVGYTEGNWSYKTGNAIHTAPAIGDDGTIYVSSDDHFLYALNPDGSLKWKYETGDVLSSPAVGSDGTIYVGSKDRQFYAINPDGTLKWVYPTRTAFTASPAIGSDGTIYAAGTEQDLYVYVCPDGNTREEVRGRIYAINPNGTLKWHQFLSGAVNSSPAIGIDGTIYIGSNGDNTDLSNDRPNRCDDKSIIPESNAFLGEIVNGHLYAINHINGAIKWDFKTLGDVDSSPAIGSDGTIYVGSDGRHFAYGNDKASYIRINPTTEGFLYAINPNGTKKWLFNAPGYVLDALGDVDSSPAVGADGTIYFGSDKNDVFALNPDGTLKWVYPTRGDVNSSPAIASDGTIYIGSEDGRLYALKSDGTLKWVFETEGNVNSSPAIGNDGTIYVGSDDGSLYTVTGNGALADSPWPKFHHDLRNTGRK